MATSPALRLGSDDVDLATRAAWLYYEGGLTQSEVSRALGIPPARVQRLIARALRDGLVRISIEGPLSGCLRLEQRMLEIYGLEFCRVVPAMPDDATGISALGRAAADYLHEAFSSRRHRIVGVGHGQTLATAIERLPAGSFTDMTVVSVLGDVPHRVGANPFDVIHALADKTKASAYLPPVPFYANSPADRDMLFRQRGVVEAFRLAADATFFVFGIGEVSESAFLCRSGMVLPEEIRSVVHEGAVSELLGMFIDAEGRRIETELHDRVIALDPEIMRGREALAVAGGAHKAVSIRAALKSGLISALVTDEGAARLLVETAPESGVPTPETQPHVREDT